MKALTGITRQALQEVPEIFMGGLEISLDRTFSVYGLPLPETLKTTYLTPFIQYDRQGLELLSHNTQEQDGWTLESYTFKGTQPGVYEVQIGFAEILDVNGHAYQESFPYNRVATTGIIVHPFDTETRVFTLDGFP